MRQFAYERIVKRTTTTIKTVFLFAYAIALTLMNVGALVLSIFRENRAHAHSPRLIQYCRSVTEHHLAGRNSSCYVNNECSM